MKRHKPSKLLKEKPPFFHIFYISKLHFFTCLNKCIFKTHVVTFHSNYYNPSVAELAILTLMTLLLMPSRVSPVAVSLPSQMALKKRCSIFASCLTVGSRNCTVSPNSQSGDLWSLFLLRCCRPHVLRICWVDRLCVVPAMVRSGGCLWLFCRSFVVVVLWMFCFVPSVLDGNVRRCLVLVSYILVTAWRRCCRSSCLLLFSGVLSSDPPALTVWWCWWLLLVLCRIPWGMVVCSWHGTGSLVACLLPLLP